MTKPFQLVAGHPALDLVNTLDWRFRETGPEELLSTYSDLLGFAEQAELLTTRQARLMRRGAGNNAAAQALQATKDLREALSKILYSIVDDQTPPAAAIKKLNHHIQAAQANRTLRWSQSSLELAFCGNSNPLLPLWLLAQSATDLLTGEATEKIRACDNPDCGWLFLDTSKNHSRRWCDMALCGNRMKARRFKAQHGS